MKRPQPILKEWQHIWNCWDSEGAFSQCWQSDHQWFYQRNKVFETVVQYYEHKLGLCQVSGFSSTHNIFRKTAASCCEWDLATQISRPGPWHQGLETETLVKWTRVLLVSKSPHCFTMTHRVLSTVDYCSVVYYTDHAPLCTARWVWTLKQCVMRVRLALAAETWLLCQNWQIIKPYPQQRSSGNNLSRFCTICMLFPAPNEWCQSTKGNLDW